MSASQYNCLQASASARASSRNPDLVGGAAHAVRFPGAKRSAAARELLAHIGRRDGSGCYQKLQKAPTTPNNSMIKNVERKTKDPSAWPHHAATHHLQTGL